MSMNVNRSHDVIFKRLLSIIKSMDDELRFYVSFNRISVISGQWKGKHEMKRRLASERISPSAGLNLAISGIRTRDPVIRFRER